MREKEIIKGFSKLSKENKIKKVASYFPESEKVEKALKSYWHPDIQLQKTLDEFSENTISNFYFPYGIAPNVIINGKNYMIPMVIEESSVVAAASNSAKFWSTRGGFHTKIIDKKKIGQVHFTFDGSFELLSQHFGKLKELFFKGTEEVTHNMRERGGGILNIDLVDMRHEIDDYFQLKAEFDTIDSMGANFINSCLEEFADILKDYLSQNKEFDGSNLNIIMSILSNYTPECLVEAWVECDIKDLEGVDPDISSEEFAWKFEKAVQVATVDTYRATTHNKGIFNGIDAVVLATGNDFRAVEACGHTYAARDGKYRSLTSVELENGKFKFVLRVPLSLGTVGGLTKLHPLAKFTMELLGDPKAEDLMQIAAVAGLANNFGALRSLTTKGIQKGHMKMHLLNILNNFGATDPEKHAAVEFFKTRKVSFKAVADFVKDIRD